VKTWQQDASTAYAAEPKAGCCLLAEHGVNTSAAKATLNTFGTRKLSKHSKAHFGGSCML
jgi:hypothetical protein